MRNWNVNVRAIVTVSGSKPDEFIAIPKWEIYDRESRENGDVLLRCDTSVTVEAEDGNVAVTIAKDTAPAIEPSTGVVETCELWVDQGIDVDSVVSMAP